MIDDGLYMYVVLTTISIGVNKRLPEGAPVSSQFKGYQDAFWSLVGLHGLMAIVSVMFIT